MLDAQIEISTATEACLERERRHHPCHESSGNGDRSCLVANRSYLL